MLSRPIRTFSVFLSNGAPPTSPKVAGPEKTFLPPPLEGPAKIRRILSRYMCNFIRQKIVDIKMRQTNNKLIISEKSSESKTTDNTQSKFLISNRVKHVQNARTDARTDKN